MYILGVKCYLITARSVYILLGTKCFPTAYNAYICKDTKSDVVIDTVTVDNYCVTLLSGEYNLRHSYSIAQFQLGTHTYVCV
jgi:hypothetical protein